MILGARPKWIGRLALDNSATKLDDLVRVTTPIVINLRRYRAVCITNCIICVCSLFVGLWPLVALMLVR